MEKLTMAHHSSYQGIEFICEEGDLSDLCAWYDHLRETEVKKSITKVKCSKYRPYDQAGFRLIVLCDHPFAKSDSWASTDDDTLINCRLGALAPEFTAWIDQNQMPAEALIGNRYTCIDWWPVELSNHVFNDLSPQGQAQWEMENHHLDCLELIRLAAISDQEFAELWRDSNEPFFAAGRLILGEFQWIREVPIDYLSDEISSEMLSDRVGEYTREFVGLIRLASSTGAESLLIDRAFEIIQRFSADHGEDISKWLEIAHGVLDESNEVTLEHSAYLAEYMKIDEACDTLRKDMADTVRGLQGEVVTLINAVLPTLEVPRSSVLFTEEQDPLPN